MFGWTEILVVGGIVALLFGARKLPEIGRGLGIGIQEFCKGVKGNVKEELEDNESSEPRKEPLE